MADSARRALVVGATGIVGQNLGTRLAADGWEVHGLSRSGGPAGAGVHPVRADLTDPAGLRAALDSLAPQLVAITAWSRRPTEQENIVVNGGAVRDVLAAVEPAGSVEHVALMTGLGEQADLVTIMAYEYRGSWSGPGSVAPIGWVDSVMAFAASQIPPEKLLLGLAVYGFDWNTTSGGAQALSYVQAAALADQPADHGIRVGTLQGRLARGG